MDFQMGSVCLILFLIIDPLGKISAFLRTLEGMNPRRQTIVIARELLFALLIIFLFNFIGETLFDFLGLSQVAVQLSAGLILFLTALRIIFPKMADRQGKPSFEEPWLVPLAVPYVASPALLATVMIFARLEEKYSTMILAILIAWGAAAIILLFSRTLYRLLGKNGLLGIERLMGMVLVMLSVQEFTVGIKLLIQEF